MQQHDRSKLNFFERQEKVWVVSQTGHGTPGGIVGVAVAEAGTGQLPGIDHDQPFQSIVTTLYRPSLAPIYGGPTLLEALWNEMDAIMERLMTGQTKEDVCGRDCCDSYDEETGVCSHADNGDKYRAEELAWVLAIVSNAYDPDINRIRKETMARWKASQGEEV